MKIIFVRWEKSCMEIVMLTATDKMWSCVREYAKNCSWRAGKSLAEKMENNSFLE